MITVYVIVGIVEALAVIVVLLIARRAWRRVLAARASLASAERNIRSAVVDLQAAAEADDRAVDVRTSGAADRFVVREIIIRKAEGRPEVVAFADGALKGPVRIEFWGRLDGAPAFAEVSLAAAIPTIQGGEA